MPRSGKGGRCWRCRCHGRLGPERPVGADSRPAARRYLAVSTGHLATPLAKNRASPERQADLYAALLDTLGMCMSRSWRFPEVPLAVQFAVRLRPHAGARSVLDLRDCGRHAHSLVVPPDGCARALADGRGLVAPASTSRPLRRWRADCGFRRCGPNAGQSGGGRARCRRSSRARSSRWRGVSRERGTTLRSRASWRCPSTR